MEIREITGLEEYITQFPVFEYQMIETEQLHFTDRVRIICEQECERYNTTWACPPAVGTLKECRDKCLSFGNGFFFSTVAEVHDIMDMKELLDTRKGHEDITAAIGKYIEEKGHTCYILSTESCDICDKCTYPDAPCRHPDIMHPCLESHGVVVMDIVEKLGMTYNLGGNTVLWFSLILFS